MISGVRNIRSKKALKLCVNLNIYSLDALKKTCYKFADQAAIFLNEIDDKMIEVVFDLAEETNKSNRKRLIHNFCNELLDQDLREKIASETEATRNLILAQAFSKTSLLGD